MTEKFNENQKNNIQNSTLSKHALMNKNTFESLNKENKRKSRDEEINQNQFVFLNHKQEPKIFEFNYQKNTFNNIISEDFNVLKGKILLLITIELKNDFSANGVSLKKTLDCLITNFIKLNKYNISNENIAIFIFFEEIHLNYNFFFNK
jgi:dihydrofolate reductase